MGDLSCSDDVGDLLEQVAAWGTLLVVEDEAAVGLYVVDLWRVADPYTLLRQIANPP